MRVPFLSILSRIFRPMRTRPRHPFRPLFVVGIVLIPLTTYSATNQIDPVRGVYSLFPGDAAITPDLLNNTGIVGVSLRTTWRKVEPKEGQWDWDNLDAAITVARSARKKVMIRVLAGTHTPEWVYARGARRFDFVQRNPNRSRTDEPSYLPIPWDETYLRYWARLVRQLGKRYGNDPAIVLVHIAGPTRSSAEMHLPKSRLDQDQWKQVGYTPKRLIAAWKQVMDVYAEAFPKQSLAVNISRPIYDDGVVEGVLDYGLEKYGARFCIQGNWLSAHTQDTFPYYKLIRQHAAKTRIGFQMLGAASWNDSPHPKQQRAGGRMGDLDIAIQKGLAAGADYFEIYQKDIQNPVYRNILRELAERLL